LRNSKEGLRFKRAIADQHKTLVAPDKVKKVILCSGQVYYDVDEARAADKRTILLLSELNKWLLSHSVQSLLN